MALKLLLVRVLVLVLLVLSMLSLLAVLVDPSLPLSGVQTVIAIDLVLDLGLALMVLMSIIHPPQRARSPR